MAYNRWLSAMFPTYSDLVHSGRKGMKWGQHIFGLPQTTGGASTEDGDEELFDTDEIANMKIRSVRSGRPYNEILAEETFYKKHPELADQRSKLKTMFTDMDRGKTERKKAAARR